ncbi:MAG: Protein-export membrane protein secD, accessory membrane protein, partial [uncultured bacterium]
MSKIKKTRFRFVGIVVLALVAGLISYPQAVKFIPPVYDALNGLKINLGLDLRGGVQLKYKADTEDIESGKVDEALQAAQDVIERRVNAFGVGEPLVQTAKNGNENMIVVELPGVKDIEDAKKKIKDTPVLEFKEEAGPESEGQQLIDSLNSQSNEKAKEILERANPPAGGGDNFEDLAKEFSQDPGSKENGGDLDFAKKGTFVTEFDAILFEKNLKNGEVYPELVESQFGWHIIQKVEEKGEGENREVRARHILFQKRTLDMIPQLAYQETGLTGKNLKSAQVVFANQGISEPQVSIKFDEEGTKLFAEITKRNIGKPLAIFLDGELQSAPTVQVEITSGEAVITGNFTADEAKEQVRRLNEGALPVPLELISQQSIEASLGEESLKQILKAGAIGLVAVSIFMI